MSKNYQNNKKSVFGICLNEKGEILVVKRYDGKFGLPGGKVRQRGGRFETETVSLNREFKKQLGIRSGVVEHVFSHYDEDNYVKFYACAPDTYKASKKNHKFIRIEELEHQPYFDINHKLVAAIYRYVKKHLDMKTRSGYPYQDDGIYRRKEVNHRFQEFLQNAKSSLKTSSTFYRSCVRGDFNSLSRVQQT